MQVNHFDRLPWEIEVYLIEFFHRRDHGRLRCTCRRLNDTAFLAKKICISQKCQKASRYIMSCRLWPVKKLRSYQTHYDALHRLMMKVKSKKSKTRRSLTARRILTRHRSARNSKSGPRSSFVA